MSVAERIPAPTTRADAVLSVAGVTKSFRRGDKENLVLDGISFDVVRGSFISIVGPSGCGKSTLLQILAGLLPSSSGSLTLDGNALTGPMPEKISVVFQEATLMPWKTALDNVKFPMQLRGVDTRIIERRSAEMLGLVGLSDARDRFPHELSGGMRQRVSIARSLAQDPEIVLMDEPFGALDEQTRLIMGNELLRIWSATGKTVIFITHSLSEAVYLSDEVIVLGGKPGRIVDRIPIGFGRPRTIEMMGSAEFGAVRNRIWGHIADQAAKGF